MSCNKRAIVFIRTGATPPVTQGEFLGFQKITPEGSFVIYCVDGLTKVYYPNGWLYVMNEQGQILETNEAQGANPQPAQPASTGFNPFGLIDWDILPGWLWIALLIAGGLIVYDKVK